jgi:hypothetical protein
MAGQAEALPTNELMIPTDYLLLLAASAYPGVWTDILNWGSDPYAIEYIGPSTIRVKRAPTRPRVG